MTKEDLLKQRYMKMLPDAFCIDNIGDIFVCKDEKQAERYEEMNKGCVSYLKLKWWEARKINDMPKYLISEKWNRFSTEPLSESGIIRKITKQHHPIYKVQEYLTTGFITEAGAIKYFEIEGSLPCTEEEYNQYRNIFSTE